MAKQYVAMEMPDELIAEFLQMVRRFDMKHDPRHEGRVQFQMVTESEYPQAKMEKIFRAIAPRPEFFAKGQIDESGAEELQKAKERLATYEDCFQQLGVQTLAELVSKHERELQVAERITNERIAEIGRPANYAALPAQEQWEIDKRLGLLDWDGARE